MIRNLCNLSSALLALAVYGGVASQAVAQGAYPAKPITIVLPFGPGGAGDKIMRVFMPKLQEDLGQPIVIDLRPGAGTNIGSEYVARAKPDGYTLLMTGIPLTVNPLLYKKMSWKLSDFEPVSLLTVAPYVMVVNPGVPARTLGELIRYSRTHPDGINFSSSGNGTGAHVAGALFNKKAGTTLVHVPYKSSGQAMTDVIGGQVQLTFSTPVVSAPLIATGRIRALGITGAKRSPLMPDVPIVAESLPGFEVLSWYGVMAPAGTPPEVLDRINNAFNKAMRDPAIVKSLNGDDMDVSPGTRADFGAFIKRNAEETESLMNSLGAKID